MRRTIQEHINLSVGFLNVHRNKQKQGNFWGKKSKESFILQILTHTLGSKHHGNGKRVNRGIDGKEHSLKLDLRIHRNLL